MLVPMYADPPGRGRVRLVFVASRQGEQDQEQQQVDIGRAEAADRPHSQGFIQGFDVGVDVDRVQDACTMHSHRTTARNILGRCLCLA